MKGGAEFISTEGKEREAVERSCQSTGQAFDAVSLSEMIAGATSQSGDESQMRSAEHFFFSGAL